MEEQTQNMDVRLVNCNYGGIPVRGWKAARIKRCRSIPSLPPNAQTLVVSPCLKIEHGFSSLDSVVPLYSNYMSLQRNITISHCRNMTVVRAGNILQRYPQINRVLQSAHVFRLRF